MSGHHRRSSAGAPAVREIRSSSQDDGGLAKSIKNLFARKHRKKVAVVVDSDAECLAELTAICEDLSFSVHSFTSSSEARDYILDQGASIALVLCNMMMPELSGMQVVQLIKSDESLESIPIILLSSFSKSKQKVQEFQIRTPDGFTVDIVIKPIERDTLVDRIRELTQSKGSSLRGSRRKLTSDGSCSKPPSSPRRNTTSATSPRRGGSTSSPRRSSATNSPRRQSGHSSPQRKASFSAASGGDVLPPRRPRANSGRGSPMSGSPERPMTRPARRMSEVTSQTPFLDTVFTGAETSNTTVQSDSRKTGPNWDDLAEESSDDHRSPRKGGTGTLRRKGKK